MTSLLFPVEHRRCIRTTHLLERTVDESRRRTKGIPRVAGERACLPRIVPTIMTATEKGRAVWMTPKILRALDALRAEGPPQQDQAAASQETLRLDTFPPRLGLDRLSFLLGESVQRLPNTPYPSSPTPQEGFSFAKLKKFL